MSAIYNVHMSQARLEAVPLAEFRAGSFRSVDVINPRAQPSQQQLIPQEPENVEAFILRKLTNKEAEEPNTTSVGNLFPGLFSKKTLEELADEGGEIKFGILTFTEAALAASTTTCEPPREFVICARKPIFFSCSIQSKNTRFTCC